MSLYSSPFAPGGGTAVLVKRSVWEDVRAVQLVDAAGELVADIAACTAMHRGSRARLMLAAAYWLNHNAQSTVPGMSGLRKDAQERGRRALQREAKAMLAEGRIQGVVLGLDANRVVGSGMNGGAPRSTPACSCPHGWELIALAEGLGALLTPGITHLHTHTSFSHRGGEHIPGRVIDYILVSTELVGQGGEHVKEDRVVGRQEWGELLEGYTDHLPVLLKVGLPYGKVQELWSPEEHRRARGHPATQMLLTDTTESEVRARALNSIAAALLAGDYCWRPGLSRSNTQHVVDRGSRAPTQKERDERKLLLGEGGVGSLEEARGTAWTAYAGGDMQDLLAWARRASGVDEQEARLRAALLWKVLKHLGQKPLAKMEAEEHVPDEESPADHRDLCTRRTCAEAGRAVAAAQDARRGVHQRSLQAPALTQALKMALAREVDAQKQCRLRRDALTPARMEGLPTGMRMQLLKYARGGERDGKSGLPAGMMGRDGAPAESPEQQAEDLQRYFTELYSNRGTAEEKQREAAEVQDLLAKARAAHSAWSAGGGTRSRIGMLCNESPTLEEFEEALKKLKPASAGGPDNLTAHHLLHAPGDWKDAYTQLMKTCWEEGLIPRGWTLARTVMLYKGKGLPELLYASYRLLIPQGIAGKWYNYTTAERLKAVMVARNQPPADFFGWRTASGPMAAALTFTELIRMALRAGLEIYACLLDLAQAFDRMSHVEVARALTALGVEGALFETVMQTMMSRKLRTSTGVHQPLA